MPVFLFTDIENSTKLWEAHAEIMARGLERHNKLILAHLERAGGRMIKHTGDGVFAVFEEGDPMACVLELQKEFQRTTWGPLGDLRIRTVLHAGPAKRMGDDYFGPTVNRAARLLGIGWGGQILLTPEIVNTAPLPERATVADLGWYLLKDLPTPQRVYQLVSPDLALVRFPPLKSVSKASEAAAAASAPVRAAAAPGRPQAAASRGMRLAETFDQTHEFLLRAAHGGLGKQDGRFRYPAGVAIDGEGRVYVSDAIRGTVQVFGRDGTYQRRLGYEGGELTLALRFTWPSAIAVDRQGRVYVCDTKHGRVQVVTLDQEILGQYGRPMVIHGTPEPPGVVGLNLPRGLAVDDEAGLLYVADTGNHRVRVLKLDGSPVGIVGRHGEREGEFLSPLGIAVGPGGSLFVADSENFRVQVFGRQGNHIATIGRRGADPGQFYHPPAGLAVTAAGDLAVCDGTDRLKFFAADGRYLGNLSGQRLHATPPKFVAVALREPEDLVVADEHGCQWHHFVYREAAE